MAEEFKIQKKEFKYRGKTLQELIHMDIRDFAKLLRANARRTILRQSSELQKFILKCHKRTQENKPIKTHSRDLIIVPQIVGLKIHIYNGRTFFPVQIEKEMLGHRLGEFSVTRTKVKHGAAGVGATRSSAALSVK